MESLYAWGTKFKKNFSTCCKTNKRKNRSVKSVGHINLYLTLFDLFVCNIIEIFMSIAFGTLEENKKTKRLELQFIYITYSYVLSHQLTLYCGNISRSLEIPYKKKKNCTKNILRKIKDLVWHA